MLFNSLTFVAFFAIVLTLYWGMRSWNARKNLLLVSSYIFYGAWNPPFAALLFSTTALDFYLGRKMGKLTEPRERRVWLWISVAVNLSMLGFFKYASRCLSTDWHFLLHLPFALLYPRYLSRRDEADALAARFHTGGVVLPAARRRADRPRG
jgi:alginate O-acetyltransferase complex protein AlgI